MPDSHTIAVHEHAHDVEAIVFPIPAMAIDPHVGRSSQLLALSPVDRFHRPAELRASSRLDLDERDSPVTFHHQIDVSMPVAEPPLHDAPPLPPEPSLRDLLSDLAECLPGR